MGTDAAQRDMKACAPLHGGDAIAPGVLTRWGRLFCPTCPAGNIPLSLDGGTWLVGGCGHRFPIREDIPVLVPEESSRWGEAGSDDAPEQRRTPPLDLCVVIPALREAQNIALLLPELLAVLEDLHATHEVVIVTGPSDPDTVRVAAPYGPRVKVVVQSGRGYGDAVRQGMEVAEASFIVTMDADLSHRPTFLSEMWAKRQEAELVIASRYIRDGKATMPLTRKLLSRWLNGVFRRGLGLSVRDMSSGYRLMRADAVQRLELRARDFDLVQEMLVKAYCQGWRIAEVPFHYAPRRHGSSRADVWAFGVAYLRTFWSLWKLRNSISSADYDDRAYDSVVPLQRYWQRTRYRHITSLIRNRGAVLDVGCGSSRIIGALPPGSVAVDIVLAKLRHARRFGVPLATASGFKLPYADAAFPCVLSSEVIEHVPKDSPMLDELCRVVLPGGRLVLGTPDYDSRLWCILEAIYARVAPGGYADEHIAHYTKRELSETMRRRGFVLEESRSILGAEIILAFRRER